MVEKMNERGDPVLRAEQLHRQGFNCAQSVFAAFAETGELQERLALQIAAPLGGGVARQGEMCGAVLGALLAIGLRRRSDLPEEKEAAYRLAQELIRQFVEQHGSYLCRSLIGFDLRTAEGITQARQSGIFQRQCPLYVRHAAELVQTLSRKE
jgi:C_GCAxxG_C_C family probable redox protein